MNLVNELQASAVREDVLIVLRKARLVASKLGVTDIVDWLKAEQDGYTTQQKIPQYRIVKSSLVFKTNGPIPMGYNQLANGIIDYPGGFLKDCPIPDSLSEIVAVIEDISKGKREMFIQIDNGRPMDIFRRELNSHYAHQVTFLLRASGAQVRAIPDAVKDKVLDWACELEQRGVVGENMTFNDKEREAAHTIIFNITDCKIEQLNNMGKNQKKSVDDDENRSNF